MGQGSSQLQQPPGSRYLDSDEEHNIVKTYSSDSPDFAFSSQLPPSTDRHPPFTFSGAQEFKQEVPSSPIAHHQPVAFHAAKVEPMNSPSATSSHHDAEISAQLPSSKKKKKRSKKHSGSLGFPADDTQSRHSRSSIGIDASVDDNSNDNDIPSVQDAFDVNEASSIGDMLSEKERRRQEKRERKAQKKAAKRAGLHLHSTAEYHTSEAREDHEYHEANILDNDDSTIPATFDNTPMLESDPSANHEIDTIPEEPKNAPATSSKKRRLSERSDAENSRKRKRNNGGGHDSMHIASSDAGLDADDQAGEEEVSPSGVTSGKPINESMDANAQSSPTSGNTNIAFSNLAESLYTSRGNTTSLDVDQHDESDANDAVQDVSQDQPVVEQETQESQESPSSPSIANDVDHGMDSADASDVPPADEMDVDDASGKDAEEDDASSESESEHGVSGLDTAHQEGQITSNEANQSENGSENGSENESERESKEESGESHEDDENDEYNSSQGDDDSSPKAPLSPAHDDNATDNMAATAPPEDQIEIPSSFPYRPNRSSERDTSTHEQSQSTTRQKRVAKPPYHSLKVGEFDSPSVSAASRRINGQTAGKIDNNATAGPFSSSTNRKQKKISAMLKTSEENSDSEHSTSHRSRSARKSPRKSEVNREGKKTGPFTDAEIRDINRTVERWREDHQMSQVEVNDLIQSHPRDVNSREMWDCITATCPGRPRQKVINLCRRKFHNFVARGAWTEEQHEELTQLVSLHGEKHSLIGKIINRHPEDVRDRIRNYVRCGDMRRTSAWDSAEVDLLTNIVLEAIEVIETQRAKRHKAQGSQSRHAEDESPVEDLVDWTVVSERMGTRGRLQCITKWKRLKSQMQSNSIDGENFSVHMIIQKARETALAMSHKDRWRIVKAIRSSGASADSRIPWAKLREEVLGERWSRAVLMVVWNRLKASVPDWKIMSTPEVVHQLEKQYRDSRTLEFPDDEDIDLDDEYESIERRLNIIKTRTAPKTPHYPKSVEFIKADDEDSSNSDEDNDDMENANREDNKANQDQHEDEDDIMEDAPLVERESSVDLGLIANSNGKSSKDDDIEIEDSEPDVKTHQSSRARRSHDELESDSSVEAPSMSESTSRKRGQSSKDRIAPKFTPGRFKNAGGKAGTPSRGGYSSSKAPPSRTQPSARSRQKQHYDEIQEVSSDTNASDVESIPAH
ncbi:hypothetical protein F4809DRAFT_628940 [Biscogniauxia mediterranea]|nr:hypothetical protein F4809DRAFT_628940 [Biscogniauxia mediterranea]